MSEHDVTAEDEPVSPRDKLTQEQCSRIIGSTLGGLVSAGASVNDLRIALHVALYESESMWRMLEIAEGLRTVASVQIHMDPVTPEDLAKAIVVQGELKPETPEDDGKN